jgi:type II secretory pathway predicted ATPase ExeA
MLCRVLMERLPATVETIYLANPSLSRDEILFAIGDELKMGLEKDGTTRVLRALQEHLLRLYGEGRRVVVLIDEAHAMPDETLEEIRLLSNLESRTTLIFACARRATAVPRCSIGERSNSSQAPPRD